MQLACLIMLMVLTSITTYLVASIQVHVNSGRAKAIVQTFRGTLFPHNFVSVNDSSKEMHQGIFLAIYLMHLL